MGKYMRKAKTTGEVSVIDLSLGVRTRAKTLALRSQSRLPPPPPPPPDQPSPPPSSGGYLQLRSRRLVKLPVLVHDSKRQKQDQHKEACNPSPNSDAGSKVQVGPTDCQTLGSGLKVDELEGGDKNGPIADDNNNKDNCDSKGLGIEASFGENVLDIEGRESSTGESTPCSLIRDPETIRTPGSTTRPTGSTETNRRIQNSNHRHIPTAHEMDEFFSRAEDKQHKQFIDKYNFDPVNDKPLPGRYEWEKLDP